MCKERDERERERDVREVKLQGKEITRKDEREMKAAVRA